MVPAAHMCAFLLDFGCIACDPCIIYYSEPVSCFFFFFNVSCFVLVYEYADFLRVFISFDLFRFRFSFTYIILLVRILCIYAIVSCYVSLLGVEKLFHNYSLIRCWCLYSAM